MDESYKLWRVRKTVLQMLSDRKYIVDESEINMSLQAFEHKFASDIQDVSGVGTKGAAYKTISREKLMTLTSKIADPRDTIFVFYPEDKRLGVKQIQDVHDRMVESNVGRAILVLRPPDSYNSKELSPQAKRAIDAVEGKGLIIETFKESELLVNITEHSLVPTHVPLDATQKQELLARYKLKEVQLPRIRMSDPVARYFGLQRTDVVKIIRPSETAGRYVTYRLVV